MKMHRDKILTRVLIAASSFLFIALIYLVVQDEKKPKPADYGKGERPISSISNEDLQVIGKYDTRFGTLYVYKLGSDTIYVGAGRSHSSPVSIDVK